MCYTKRFCDFLFILHGVPCKLFITLFFNYEAIVFSISGEVRLGLGMVLVYFLLFHIPLNSEPLYDRGVATSIDYRHKYVIYSLI